MARSPDTGPLDVREATPAFAPAKGWIVGPRFDLGFVIGPTVMVGLVALSLPADLVLPTWGWIVVVLGVDVAHVYATLYRTYFDLDELRRRPTLYLVTPLVALAGCAATQWIAPAWFWTCMAYLAAFHFVRQVVGVAVLYRARAGRPTRDLAGRMERAAAYAVTLFPLWWWHVSLPRPFDWFVAGDFFLTPPAWTLVPAGIVTAGILAAHLFLRAREGGAIRGADLWLAASGFAWFAGIVWTASDAAFTVANVVAHGVPYVALVWWTSSRRWSVTGRGALHRSLFVPMAAPLFFGLLVALAAGEEAAWDLLVWREHSALFGTWSDPVMPARVAIVLLSVPQVTHYLLDGFVWKLSPSNPDLPGLLAVGRSSPATPD